ncbi:glutathione S-transferase C-terminal domain-containing protein isoform X2 [Siniperca chuatsi]|uniref:glutathione S-transferase C-terminal domain-containing protein isoform X2 n=1 Tax=Siniperca chuatsi TaxID=119488 RepID=UPI001CE1C782|nr:glutathione S-transferase C-terminal domain-containing protein isoform X2 [Siniperca chuatsi]
MKHTEVKQQHPSLYLEVCSQNEEQRLPLHTSIALFLLSYCECKSFKVFLVFTKPACTQSLKRQLPESLDVSDIQLEDLPQLVRGCRLPAVLDETGRLCRAGLAVVLRHIINKTLEADPSRNDVLALLGFKKTCLKACAEVSKWTRLCEIGIPSAIEEHLKNPSNQYQQLPLSILTLERRLAEPVKVHNDDKIRRQKLQEQRQNEKNESPEGQGNPDSDSEPGQAPQVCDGLELRAALAKLSVDSVPTLTTRENSEIRKVKTTDLPPLEHVFAEGLYFTLTDVVLLPCIYQYLCSLQVHAVSTLYQLPYLLRWYSRVQEVPGVLRAAKACGMALSIPQVPTSSLPGPSAEDNPTSLLEQEEGQEMTTELPFVGGPRPTMTKLQENGIEAVFAPHPCPAWTLPWDSLPGPINPTEGCPPCMWRCNRHGDGALHPGRSCLCHQSLLLRLHPERNQVHLPQEEHMILCRFADQTAVQLPPERRLIGKQCMGLVDLDRLWAAETHGYLVRVMTMEPESCSPKNNMLVGRPLQKSGLEVSASQLEALVHN